MNERERIVSALRGRRADVLPWATRLDIWHTSRRRTGNMPARYADKDLMEIHREVKLGRQKYAILAKTRLRGVDMTVEVDGVVAHRESSPTINFPTPGELAVSDRPANTVITFATPAGKAQIRYRINKELVNAAAVPYLMEHVLGDDDAYPAVEWMLKHAEIEPAFQDYLDAEALVGDEGFTIGMLPRIPFQRLLIDFLSEERTFYLMADDPRRFHSLLDMLREQNRQMLDVCLQTSSLVIEYGDNFDGNITSPKLFRQYAMPDLHEAADKVHAHGRLLGSHMDGEMKPLLYLIPESGVDLVESFSPAPLCRLTFAEAWRAWRGKALMWGAIPSPIFEAHYSDAEFDAWIREMLELIGDDGVIILGIGDQAVGPSLIDRVARASALLGR